MKFRHIFGAALGLVLVASALAGPRGKLSVGDAAPGLDIEQWVKGKQVELEQGNVYVVEFWATWCAPCRKSIPHLTKLQKEYEDDGLTIIGVSDEEPSKIKQFVRKQGKKMDYTVVADRRKSTNRAWMQAAGQNGIPTAFVVDREGKVAFIGNPLTDEFDAAVRAVMSGRYDPKLAKAAKPLLDSARQARKLHNWRIAVQSYNQVVEMDAGVFADIAIERFQMELVEMGSFDATHKMAAYVYADQLISNEFAEDAGALRMLAEAIISDPTIPQGDRDFDVALDAASAARRLAGPKDVRAMSALAAVHYHRGDLEEAVKLQTQAWRQAKPKAKADLKRDLEIYKAAERTVVSR